jgi:two-component system, NarL family, sensor histidine kinase UhpB
MQSVSDQLHILVVEDNPVDFYLIEGMLQSRGAGVDNIHSVSRVEEAVDFLDKNKVDLVLLDLSLPDSFGIDSFLGIKSQTQHIPVIILTGQTESETALEVIKHGAQDYLVKGDFKADLLVKSIQYSIERKNAEENLVISEEKYRQLFYKNPFPAWIYDRQTLQILEVNDAAVHKYEYTKEEFLTLKTQDVRMEDDISEKLESRQQLHMKKNGSIMIVEVTYFQINYFGTIAMQALINDVTEKVRLEKELREQQKLRQRQITKAALEAQEEERKVIGAELHDNINQILATSKLYLTAAIEDNMSNPEMVSKACNYISSAIEEIRKLSKALVTPLLIESGLRLAVEEMVGDIMAVKKISIETDIDETEDDLLTKDIKVALYRIVQEQLNNIIKYAEASLVTIRIKTGSDAILLSIQDNGKGFDTNARRRGVGITNIQSRAELFNGKMEIISSPGNGCQLKVKLFTKMTTAKRAA